MPVCKARLLELCHSHFTIPFQNKIPDQNSATSPSLPPRFNALHTTGTPNTFPSSPSFHLKRPQLPHRGAAANEPHWRPQRRYEPESSRKSAEWQVGIWQNSHGMASLLYF
jgi:hypothetical protein